MRSIFFTTLLPRPPDKNSMMQIDLRHPLVIGSGVVMTAMIVLVILLLVGVLPTGMKYARDMDQYVATDSDVHFKTLLLDGTASGDPSDAARLAEKLRAAGDEVHTHKSHIDEAATTKNIASYVNSAKGDATVAFESDEAKFAVGAQYNGGDHELILKTPNTTASLNRVGRVTGFNTLPERYELRKILGSRGKPGINGDINSATEGTREIADPDFEILGVNHTSALCTFYAEGGVTLTTATTASDAMIIAPHLDANQTAWTQVTWGTDQQVQWECDITTHSVIGATTYYAGLKLTNTDTVATDDNQVFFRYQNGVGSGTWQMVSSIAGTDTSTNSTVTVAASTRYHLKIIIDSSRVAHFFINGVKMTGTSGVLTNSIDLIPYIGVVTSDTTASVLNVTGEAISRKVGA